MEPESKAETPDTARRDLRVVLGHLGVNVLYGVLLGVAVAGALIMFDIGSVGTLIVRSTDPLLAAVTVIVPFSLLFGGAAAASSIGLLMYRRKFRR